MKRILFDIETDGLVPDLTKVHSLVLLDMDTEEVLSCADQEGYTSIADGMSYLKSAELLAGHNIQGFDFAALHKLFGFEYEGEIHDTLIMSRLVWPDLKNNDFNWLARPGGGKNFPRQLIGSHSLKAWGLRLGNHKDGYSDGWEEWSEAMQTYCVQDCRANLTFYKRIMSKKPSAQSVKLEHDFAHVIRKQEAHGFHFDEVKAHKLLATLQGRQAELNDELQVAFKPWEIREPFTPKVNNKARGYVKGQLTYKVKEVVFNPASRDHIADRLQTLGWVAQAHTEQGKPKVDETVLAGLDYPEAALLNEYLMLNKRIGQLAVGQNAWLKKVQSGKIHGQVNTNGASTGRCTHNRPNVAQTPSVNAPYGTQCRELFYAPEGYSLVGADLSGLELRCLAHMMAKFDGGSYTDVVLNGDVHSVNQKAAGLPDRNSAKTFIYGFLYGAGSAKIGSIVGGTEKEGRALINKFMKATPALRELRIAVQETIYGKYIEDSNRNRIKIKEGKGHLIGLDGRKLSIRSPHSALNVLLQSAGALLAKQATVFLYQNLTIKGYKWGEDYAQVAHVHDEVQLIARKEIAEDVGREAVKSFQLAGEHFNFRCPITGDFKIGNSWADTH